MTSPAGTSSRRQSGFSLVEMLVVLAILTFLIGMVATAVGGLRGRARVKAVESQIQRVGLYIEKYREARNEMPEDGLESAVETPDGTTLQSGAALTFALARPQPRWTVDAGGNRKQIGTSDPIGEFKDSELYVDPDDSDAVELIDSWGNAFHYDALAKGAKSYNLQDSGDVHLDVPEEHGDDPREDETAVAATGPQNPKGYDLWSHGPNGHGPDAQPSECIPSWQKPAGK